MSEIVVVTIREGKEYLALTNETRYRLTLVSAYGGYVNVYKENEHLGQWLITHFGGQLDAESIRVFLPRMLRNTQPKEDKIMDPDVTLAQIRELQASENYEDPDIYKLEMVELADLVQALDEWLTQGGYPPAAWSRFVKERDDMDRRMTDALSYLQHTAGPHHANITAILQGKPIYQED